MLHEDKHHFALYWEHSSSPKIKVETSVVIDEELLVHRIIKVLRLTINEAFTLFDEQVHVEVKLLSIQKRSITVHVDSIIKNQLLLPVISCIVPILKREALEHTLYNLVEIGVNEIQLVFTQKTQRNWAGHKEFERMRKIMIAAAEQSKQFSLPHIYEPIQLQEYLHQKKQFAPLIFFDTNGISLAQWFTSHSKIESVSLLIGPEGDLTPSEKNAVRAIGAQIVSLTPTVLRAQQAITLGAGAIRSLLTGPDKA